MSDQNLDQNTSSIAASSADPSVRPDADIRSRLAAHPWPVFGAAFTEQLRAAAAARAAQELPPASAEETFRRGRKGSMGWSRREVWGTGALALLLMSLIGLAWTAGNLRNAQSGPVPTVSSGTVASDGIGLLPVGAAVAWIDDNGLWYLVRGGQPRRLAEGGYLTPRISPDRAWVAFQDVGGTIHLVSTSGGAPRMLLAASRLPVTGSTVADSPVDAGSSQAPPYRRPMRLTWTPDSHALVFSTIVSPSDDPHGNEIDDLWIVGLADAQPLRLLPPGRATYFAISPDGRRVAATSNGDGTSGNGPAIETVDIDGSTSRTLLRLGSIFGDGEPEAMSGWTYLVPQWAPDSQALLVAVPSASNSGVRHATTTQTELYRLPVDGEPVLMSSIRVQGGALNGVRWSPDASQTAYVVAPTDADSPETPDTVQERGQVAAYPPPGTSNWANLVVGSQDGSQGHVITAGSNMELDSWSPDGQMLLLRDGRFDQPAWRFVPVTGPSSENQSSVADTPVMRFVGPRDALYISAAPNSRIGIDRVGAGGREFAHTASGPVVEFDVVPAGGVPGGLPPATMMPVGGAPDTIIDVTPPPTPSSPRQSTLTLPNSTGTPSIVATSTPLASIGPEQQVESFAFMPGTADIAFTVSGDFPGNRRALFVQRVDSTTLRLAPTAEELARVPSGFDKVYFYQLSAGPAGGPLVASAHDGNLAFDLFAVSAAGTITPPIAKGRYNPLDFTVAPTGDRLAILTEEGRLLLRDLASGSEQQVADGLFGDSGATGADFVFSPDGSHLALGWQGQRSLQNPAGYEIDSIDVGTGRNNRLVSVTSADSSVGLFDQAFAASGKSIYFFASSPTAAIELFVVDNHPGAVPRRLGRLADLTGSDKSPGGLTALPDGKSLLVMQDHAIYRIDPTAGTSTRLTPSDEKVDIGGLQVTTALGHTWVAYRVHRNVNVPSAPGFEASSELRLMRLD